MSAGRIYTHRAQSAHHVRERPHHLRYPGAPPRSLNLCGLGLRHRGSLAAGRFMECGAGGSMQPNRARWINRAPESTGTVTARNARAGSAMPEASETTSGNAMTAEETKEWEKCRRDVEGVQPSRLSSSATCFLPRALCRTGVRAM
jgi:hypothetical protein